MSDYVFAAGQPYRITFEYWGWGIGTQPFYFGHCTVNPVSEDFLAQYPNFTPNPNPLFDDAVYAELQPSEVEPVKVSFVWTPTQTYTSGVFVLFGRREGTSGQMRITAASPDPVLVVAPAAIVAINGSGQWPDTEDAAVIGE